MVGRSRKILRGCGREEVGGGRGFEAFKAPLVLFQQMSQALETLL